MNNQPRILIGCPTFEGMSYCIEHYLKAVKELTYKNFELVLVDNSKTRDYYRHLTEKGLKVLRLANVSEDKMQNVIDSRNVLKEFALQENFDYFFSLEQDVIPPKDAIESLLKFGKEITSGLYMGVFVHEGKPGLKPLLYTWLSQKEFDEVITSPHLYTETFKKIKEKSIKSPDELKRHMTVEEVQEPKFMEVKYAGVGCMLIKKEVLEKIEFRKSEGNLGTDDISFCDDARKHGYKVHAYTGVVCGHLKRHDKFDNFS